MENFVIDGQHVPHYIFNTCPILVVEDDPDMHNIVKKCYELSGRTNPYIQFEDGQQLIDYMEKVLTGERPMPALVLMDLHLNEKKGCDILKTVREMTNDKDDPVIIMYSASNEPEIIQKCMDMQANGFLRKPESIQDYISFFKGI